MMRLGAGLYASPTGSLLLDLARAQGVTFSTNERGFASFTCAIALPLIDSFYIYDRATLPHIAVTWAGGVVWEGRLEDVAIIPGGLRLTALGYIRGYADAPYSVSHIGVTANTIVNALIAATATLNSFMSSSTMLVQNPGVTITEIYEDQYPVAILDRLCNLGDSQTTPRLWEAGVWENRMLHFRPRGDAARKWYIDVAAPEIERTLETLYNSVYAVYQDGGNQRAVTATSTDATSVARYGLTRRAAVGLQAIDATLAGKVRDAYLQDHKDPPPRADVGFGRLYDQFGTLWPAYVARSSDTLTLRNLPPTASADIDRIRTFRLKETRYDADADWMTVVPESLHPGLGPQENATRLTSVTDPNNQYQPRPTLAELYADFQGLPGLRGLWYPGSVDNTGALYDQSGQGRTLTYNGNPQLSFHNGFIPYYAYDATGDWHSRADEAGLSLLGNESYVAAAQRGFTVGVIVLSNNTPGGTEGFITQQDGSFAGSAFDLYTNAAQSLIFNIYQPASLVQATAAGVITAARWHFAVGRFTSGASVDAILNGAIVASTATAATATNNSAAAFGIAGYSGGGLLLDGGIALAFACATALPNGLLSHLFERVRKFYGV